LKKLSLRKMSMKQIVELNKDKEGTALNEYELAKFFREELLVQYRIQPYQLPQIKSSDPAVKAIGAKPGDILRIIRKSQTAGTHIAYRYIVE